MSGLSEMSSDDTAASDALTNSNDVSTAVSTVASVIAPSELTDATVLCHRQSGYGRVI